MLNINKLLLLVCLTQFFLYMYYNRVNNKQYQRSKDKIVPLVTPILNSYTSDEKIFYDGVAVCLFLHTPNWFQRRYTIMIQNIQSKIPRNWTIQIFYTGKGKV